MGLFQDVLREVSQRLPKFAQDVATAPYQIIRNVVEPERAKANLQNLQTNPIYNETEFGKNWLRPILTGGYSLPSGISSVMDGGVGKEYKKTIDVSRAMVKPSLRIPQQVPLVGGTPYGELAGGLFLDPTNYIMPGGSTAAKQAGKFTFSTAAKSFAKRYGPNMAVNAGQGLLMPAENNQERFANTALSTALGVAIPAGVDAAKATIGAAKATKRNLSNEVAQQFTRDVRSPQTSKMPEFAPFKSVLNMTAHDRSYVRKLSEQILTGKTQGIVEMDRLTKNLLPGYATLPAPKKAELWSYLIDRVEGRNPTFVPDVATRLERGVQRVSGSKINERGFARFGSDLSDDEIKKRADEILDQYIREELMPNAKKGVVQGGLIQDADGKVTGRFGRQSNNYSWYRRAYGEKGRALTKEDYKKIAIDHLMKGNQDPDWNIPANQEFIELAEELVRRKQGTQAVADTSLLDKNKQQSQANTNKTRQETLDGNRENFRVDTDQNISIAKGYSANKLPDDANADTMVTISRVGDGDIKNGDYVVLSGSENAQARYGTREGGKLTTKQVRLGDLVSSGGLKDEFIYNPKKSIESMLEDNNGWKPGMREQFDLALLTKNADEVKRMLPDVPEEYQTRFKNEIDALTKTPEPPNEIPRPNTEKLGFEETIKKMPETTENIKNQLGDEYGAIKIDEAVEYGRKELARDYTGSVNRVLGSEEWNAEVSGIGMAAIEKAIKEGKDDEVIELTKVLARKANASGQGNAVMKYFNLYTPEGMLRYAQKAIDEANTRPDLLKKLTGRPDIELDEPLTKQILDKMREAQKMPLGEERDKVIAQVLDLIRTKIPPRLSELVDAYRYNNILSSPLTQLRNVYQNFLVTGFSRPAELAVTPAFDWAQSAITGAPRTTSFMDPVNYYRGMLSAFPRAFSAALQSFKEGDVGSRIDLETGRATQKSANIPVAISWASRALEAGDRFFMTLIGSGEQFRLLKNGASLEEAYEGALKISRQQLFKAIPDPKNKSGQGLFISQIDKLTNMVNAMGREFPPVRWFVPFVTTPMNVAKSYISNSPIGFLNVVGAANKPEVMARATIGTVITGVGAAMALQDRTTWGIPQDPTERELFLAANKKPYAVKIGEEWIPMQYFGVYALAFALPAAYKYNFQDQNKALTDSDFDKLIKGTAANLGFFSEQTFFEGMNNFVKLAQGDTSKTFGNSLSFTAWQTAPWSGAVQYINTWIDPAYRKSESFIDGLKRNVPGLSQELEQYRKPDGTPSERDVKSRVLPYATGTEDKNYADQLDGYQEVRQFRATLNDEDKEKEKNIDNMVNTIMDLPADKRLAEFDRLLAEGKITEDNLDSITNALESRRLAKTGKLDAAAVARLPTTARAEFVYKKLKSLPKEDRLRVFDEYVDAGVFTDKVLEEYVLYLEAEKKQ